ncbi:MAG: hypothetical protein RR959_08515, partial [Erysipelotrichaceae bacterium]
KDYIKSLQNAIKDDPTLAGLEVWNLTDDEGNSIRPCDGCITEGYVNKEKGWDTEDYVTKDNLSDHLSYYGIEMDEFLEDHKPIILI